MHNKLMTQNWVIGLLCNVFYHLIAIDKSCQVGHATIIESLIVALEIFDFLFLLMSCINAAVYFLEKGVPYGPIQSMVQYGSLWSCMVPYVPVWLCIVPYGRDWSLMIPYGPVWSLQF